MIVKKIRIKIKIKVKMKAKVKVKVKVQELLKYLTSQYLVSPCVLLTYGLIYSFILGQSFLVVVQNTQLLGSSPGKPLVIQPYAGEEFNVIEDPTAGPCVKLGQLLNLSRSHLGSQMKGM